MNGKKIKNEINKFRNKFLNWSFDDEKDVKVLETDDWLIELFPDTDTPIKIGYNVIDGLFALSVDTQTLFSSNHSINELSELLTNPMLGTQNIFNALFKG